MCSRAPPRLFSVPGHLFCPVRVVELFLLLERRKLRSGEFAGLLHSEHQGPSREPWGLPPDPLLLHTLECEVLRPPEAVHRDLGHLGWGCPAREVPLH